ncbi:hypothetical protein lerEdw1_011622 [Lerista edwardsae]|nr:hypothetical protein lerEdw1_011622 [Lerista edwardsae]
MTARAWITVWKPLIGLLFLGSEITGDSSHPSEITFSLGTAAKISCNHGILQAYVVFWYLHRQDTTPHSILSSSTPEKGRLRMTVDKPKKSTELFISEVDLADAGVYYCAASDTVVGRRRRPEQKPAGRRDWRALG